MKSYVIKKTQQRWYFPEPWTTMWSNSIAVRCVPCNVGWSKKGTYWTHSILTLERKNFENRPQRVLVVYWFLCDGHILVKIGSWKVHRVMRRTCVTKKPALPASSKRQFCLHWADRAEISWTLLSLRCTSTKFGPDRVGFAEFIRERLPFQEPQIHHNRCWQVRAFPPTMTRGSAQYLCNSWAACIAGMHCNCRNTQIWQYLSQALDIVWALCNALTFFPSAQSTDMHGVNF